MVDSAALLAAAVAVRTAIVLAALVVGIRFVNKRHVGELTMHDILLVLMAANAVQNAMTNGDGRLTVVAVSAMTLLLVGWLAAVLLDWSPSLERRVAGVPVVLVHDGRLIRRNLRRARIDQQEVAAAVRQQGILRLSDVRLAMLETNGSISIVPRERQGKGQ